MVFSPNTWITISPPSYHGPGVLTAGFMIGHIAPGIAGVAAAQAGVFCRGGGGGAKLQS